MPITEVTAKGSGPERHEVTITSKNQITLPAAFCRRLGLARGDRIELIVEPEGTVRMVPLRMVPDLQRFAGIWKGGGLLGHTDGNAYVDELRGPAEPEA